MYFERGELCDESSHLVVKKLGVGEPMGGCTVASECMHAGVYYTMAYYT
jgi:hypothetical protein